MKKMMLAKIPARRRLFSSERSDSVSREDESARWYNARRSGLSFEQESLGCLRIKNRRNTVKEISAGAAQSIQNRPGEYSFREFRMSADGKYSTNRSSDSQAVP